MGGGEKGREATPGLRKADGEREDGDEAGYEEDERKEEDEGEEGQFGVAREAGGVPAVETFGERCEERDQEEEEGHALEQTPHGFDYNGWGVEGASFGGRFLRGCLHDHSDGEADVE